MSQSWFSKRQDRDADWTDPDFRERTAPTERAAPARARKPKGRRWGTWLLRGIFALAAMGWLGIVGWSFVDPSIGVRLAPFLEIVSRLSVPLVLVVGLALLVMMLAGHWDNDDEDGRLTGEEARELASQAAHAANRIAEAHAQLMNHSKGYAAAADRSATALLDAVAVMTERGDALTRSTSASVTSLTALSEKMGEFDKTTPLVERRLSELTETLACLGVELRERTTYLETRLKDAATAAETTRHELIAAGDSLNDRFGAIRDNAKAAGDELTTLSELSSARIDLTLDRVKSVLDSTEQRIDAQNDALTQLVDRSNESMASASQQSLERFLAHCSEIETSLDRLDSRIDAHSDKSTSWLETTKSGAAGLAEQFDALEQSAIGRTERLGTAMLELSGETRRLTDALEAGGQSSEHLIKRAEALLLVLDSGVRELDDAVPAAIGRVEERLDLLRQRIADAAPGVESIEAVADAVVGRLSDAGKLSSEHAAALDKALTRSQAALAEQKAQVEALAEAVTKASDGMAQIADKVGPDMLGSLAQVRESAEAAAKRAREAIKDAIPQAATELGDASSKAVQQAVSATVMSQLEKLTKAANDAVKAANDAAAGLDRQLKALQSNSAALDRRLASSAEQIEGQDRELLTKRSGELIEMLNSRAIDVSKWLGHDISQAEWQSYLKGDQGIFARRAVKMLGRRDTRFVQALYREDEEFSEHVNRYVHDFETLLKSVLSARDGSALAVTMLSSDLGKLYVGLAQASERLRKA